MVEGDDHCEAYTTIVWGRLSSRERYYAAEAEAFDIAEGNMCGTAMRGSIAQPWSKTLSRTKGASRNLGDLAFGRATCAAAVRMGKVMSRSQWMSEREKSDPAVVAVKSANEAGQPVEAQMEPRAGAEGNASRQSTLRTQNRAGVSQALGRIRKAARGSKKEKFTALLHHVDVRLLRESYLTLKRDAAPGVDGMAWEDYGLDVTPVEQPVSALHVRQVDGPESSGHSL